MNAISKFVDVYIQSNSGLECGYSDIDYERNGCYVRDDISTIIEESDILLFPNPIEKSLTPSRKKIVIANIDLKTDTEQLALFQHENIDLYTFDAISDEGFEGIGEVNFKDKFVNFIRFHLGDPVHSDFIKLFAKSQVLQEGELVN